MLVRHAMDREATGLVDAHVWLSFVSVDQAARAGLGHRVVDVLDHDIVNVSPSSLQRAAASPAQRPVEMSASRQPGSSHFGGESGVSRSPPEWCHAAEKTRRLPSERGLGEMAVGCWALPSG